MDKMEKVVALAKRRGFVYPTSEIYGGLSNSYDYGPVGTELLRNIRNLWWREFIQKRDDMVGLDTQVILNPQTWVASGHVGSFSDPMVEDLINHKRYRADHIIESFFEKGQKEMEKNDKTGRGTFVPTYAITENKWILVGVDNKLQIKRKVEDMSIDEMDDCIRTLKIKSPDGNELSEPKSFNLLFETAIGSVSGDKSKVYLRGETAQGIFTNFKQVTDSTRVKLPFGIGNIGKSFRNEITTGQFIFRTLEFEQAEVEYFFDPENSDWEKLIEDWKVAMFDFVTKTFGVSKDNLRWRRHTDKERSHYSKDTYDLDYKFPFGWKELWGIAYRTNYDLTQHNLGYIDPVSGRKFVPHVIEPAVGINRLFLMLLSDAYSEGGERIVLKLNPRLAPYKAAVFPLLANKPELVEKAREIYKNLQQKFMVNWDDRGNIGKRYAAQDEVGTPYCITVDFDSLKDNAVTVRDRDTAKQKRVSIDKLENFLQTELS